MEEEERLSGDLYRELETADTERDPYKIIIKKMLFDLLSARSATERGQAEANTLQELQNLAMRSQLVSSLELAIVSLDNAYQLGLVTLKENVSLALLLAGEEEEDKVAVEDLYQPKQEMDWNDDIEDPEEDKLLINKVDEDAVEAVTKVPVTKSEVRSYPCDQCDFQSTVAAKLTKHMKTVHKTNKVSCKLCKASAAAANIPYEPEYLDLKQFRTHITKIHKAEISKQLPTEEDLSRADNAELEQCDMCEVKCASAGELQMHKELQHNENNGVVVEYSCDQCEYKTRNPRRLPEHIRSSHEEKVYLCDECEYKTAMSGKIRQHKANVHKSTVFTCRHCEDSTLEYTDFHQFRNHIKEAHRVTGYTCGFCGYLSTGFRDLKRHKEEKHTEEDLKTPMASETRVKPKVKRKFAPLPNGSVKKKKLGNSAMFNCSLCEFSISKKAELHKHLLAQHPDAYPNQDSLQDLESHVTDAHSGVMYQCDQCAYRIKSRATFLIHVKDKHETEGGYHCDQCTFKSTSQAYLKTHTRFVHEGVQYPCNHCDYTAATRNILKNHIKYRHADIRVKYQCDECEKTLVNLYSLKKHKRIIHQGLKYQCDQCEYTVGTALRLKQHKESVHDGKVYPCAECDYKGSNPECLQRHMEKKHLGVKYRCEECDFMCINKRYLIKHQKLRHKQPMIVVKKCPTL